MLRLWGLLGVAFAMTLGCETPTALQVSNESEVACSAGAKVVLVVGSVLEDLPARTGAATSTACASGAAGSEVQMGDVVLVPSGAKNEGIAFAMMTRPDGKSPEGCLNPAQTNDCIVAKRELRFIPHTELAMRIDLRLSCLGVLCAPDQTCVKGACVGAAVPSGACIVSCGEGDLVWADAGLPDANDAATHDTGTEAKPDGNVEGDAVSIDSSTETSSGSVMNSSSPVESGPAVDAPGDSVSDVAEEVPATDAPPDTTTPDAGSLVVVGGTLSGLASGDTVVLENNGSDALTLIANGAFTFSVPLPNGATYDVTVEKEPGTPAETCTVTAGVGTVNGGGLGSVGVHCVPNVYTVGGTLAGLASGDSVVLQDNGSNNLFLGSNGSFVFSLPIASGAAYAVTVLANPSIPTGQTCSVAGGSGTVGSANATGATVTCMTNPAFPVGGTIRGLASGESVTLTDNGAFESASFTGNGAPSQMFVFSNPVQAMAMYSVAVSVNPSSPMAQTCTVASGGGGTVGNAPVTNVQIVCGPYVLVSGQASPIGLATDGINLYWTSYEGAVLKSGIDGSNVTLLASGSSPYGIATDGVNVYWADFSAGVVEKVGIDGSGLATLANAASPSFVATDGTNVYFTDYAAHTLSKVGVSGAGLTTLAAGELDLYGVATDGAHVYWADQSNASVMRIAIDGSGLVAIATGQGSPYWITTDGTNVYWTGATTATQVAISGGIPTTLGSSQSQPTGICSDGVHVYWTDQGGGTVMRTAIDGTGLVTMATGQNEPAGITFDPNNLYWANHGDGTIVAMPK